MNWCMIWVYTESKLKYYNPDWKDGIWFIMKSENATYVIMTMKFKATSLRQVVLLNVTKLVLWWIRKRTKNITIQTGEYS